MERLHDDLQKEKERQETLQMIRHYADWQGEAGLANIKPSRFAHLGEFSEGFDIVAVLRRLFENDESILDIGCGYGRVCEAFDASKYLGIDINRDAIQQARERHPNHTFQHIASYEQPYAEGKLLLSMAFHVPDEEIGSLLEASANSRHVVIAETMYAGSRTFKKNTTVQRHYGRTAAQYSTLMKAHGMRPFSIQSFPTAHKPGLLMTFIDYGRESGTIRP